jgi:hypothetical protein
MKEVFVKAKKKWGASKSMGGSLNIAHPFA